MQRHQIIDGLTASHPDKAAEAALVLWEQLATEIVAIIGVSGFNSLYARSLFLTQNSFPWLVRGTPSQLVDERFVQLQKNLDSQPPGAAIAANNHLLRTFTDILADLIGEELTSSILRSAWGDHAPAQDQQKVKHD